MSEQEKTLKVSHLIEQGKTIAEIARELGIRNLTAAKYAKLALGCALRDRNQAERMNRVLDLRKKGLTQEEIAESIGVFTSHVAKDFKLLEQSVSPKTAEQFFRRKMYLDQELPLRINKVFDLRKQGKTQAQIAIELGMASTMVSSAFKLLRRNALPETEKLFAGRNFKKPR